jgi:hypothetical protein
MAASWAASSVLTFRIRGIEAALSDLEIGMPRRVDLKTGGGIDPCVATWWPRVGIEPKTCLQRQTVALVDVAGATTGNDVLPGVIATLGTREHMIERLGRPSAVLALMPVPTEDGTPGDRGGTPIRDFDESVQPHHRRDVDKLAL